MKKKDVVNWKRNAGVFGLFFGLILAYGFNYFCCKFMGVSTSMDIQPWMIPVGIMSGMLCSKFMTDEEIHPVAVPSAPVKQETAAAPSVPTRPITNTTAEPIEKVKKTPTTKPASKKKRFDFSCVAGYETTKANMQFLASCLRDPASLRAVGAELPSGILLYGPPGTGKTMIAKALAGEANVRFLSVSASDFIEKYVGVGAKRVRELFEAAREKTPSIVFIDELDAVGKQRAGDTNDERQQTLNQLLVEMGAIAANHENIMVIGATNDLESLDSALTRPGRFDRKISVPLPNQQDRRAILAIHTQHKTLAKDVDLNKLASMTEGMSGAGLHTLVNEAAIQAAFHKHSAITAADMDAALFRIMTGGEKQENMNAEDLRTIAYHEAGHALAVKLLTSDHVPQVSIIGSTSGSLGLTMYASTKDKTLMSRKQMEAQIKTLYAGRAAEECLFNGSDDITTGASDDLKRASVLIRDYLTTYGMSSSSVLNLAAFSGTPDADITQEAKELAKKLYEDTKSLLMDNRKKLDRVAGALVQKKTLNESELDKLLKEE